MMNLLTIDTEQRVHSRLLLKCVDGRWTSEGVDVTGSQLLALHTLRALQRWEAQNVVETIVQAPDGVLPNVDDLNSAIPKSTWELGLDGKPKPPWQLEYVVYLLDVSDASLLTFVNSTFGAKMAYERLTDRGAMDAVPFTRCQRNSSREWLDAKTTKTKTGPKQRPEFTVIDWPDLGAIGKLALESAPPRVIEGNSEQRRSASRSRRSRPRARRSTDDIPF